MKVNIFRGDLTNDSSLEAKSLLVVSHLFWPTYWYFNPGTCLFLLQKCMFIGSQCPKKVGCASHNNITDCRQFFGFWLTYEYSRHENCLFSLQKWMCVGSKYHKIRLISCRKQNCRLLCRNLWSYWSTDGLGLYEYLLLSEAIGAQPVWVVNVGISHKEQVRPKACFINVPISNFVSKFRFKIKFNVFRILWFYKYIFS